jgi:hypothetical protein
MNTSRKEFFCSRKKPEFTLWGRNGVHLSVTFKPIRRVIRVQDGTKKSREISFLPNLWGRIVPLGLLALTHTPLGLNAPFTTKIDHVGMNPSRDLDIHTDIHAREGVETAIRNGIHGCGNAELKNPYQ